MTEDEASLAAITLVPLGTGHEFWYPSHMTVRG